MTIQNPMASLCGDHPGKQWASGHQEIPSCQRLGHKSRQHNWLLRQCNLYIPISWSDILPLGRRINMSLRWWHPRWYSIHHLDDWILPLMYIFTRHIIDMIPVSNWFHRKQEICGSMSPVLMTWQATSSAQNATPKQPLQAFWRWSWHMWIL